jgi:hypothetical protein
MIAELVLDTQRHEIELGARSFDLADRRLLYRGGSGLVELRIPPSEAVGDEPWVFGQFVPVDPAGLRGSVRVTLRDEDGGTREVVASDAGDFALPWSPTRPFSLECADDSGPLVVVRFQP